MVFLANVFSTQNGATFSRNAICVLVVSKGPSNLSDVESFEVGDEWEALDRGIGGIIVCGLVSLIFPSSLSQEGASSDYPQCS